MATYIVLQNLYDPDSDHYRINNETGEVEYNFDNEWRKSAYNHFDVSATILSLAASGYEMIESAFDYEKPYGSTPGRDAFYKSFLMKHENDPDYNEGAKAYLNGKPFESPYQGNLTMWGASHHSWCSGYVNAKLMVSQLEEKE